MIAKIEETPDAIQFVKLLSKVLILFFEKAIILSLMDLPCIYMYQAMNQQNFLLNPKVL